jgi:hypothetical protein
MIFFCVSTASYFEPQLKKHWVGENYTKCGSLGNDITKTNVSNIRLAFRLEKVKARSFCMIGF